MTRDWLEWHDHYDTPDSALTHRLTAVHRDLRRALAEAPRTDDGYLHLISICAGEGRDVLPVLADHDSGHKVKALLIELDPTLAERARTMAAKLGVQDVTVKTADAGTTDTYRDAPPAHVILACGVFGNMDATNMQRTVATLPTLLAPDGIVIWTRSARRAGHDPSQDVRASFLASGFTEMSFSKTTNDMFRVGMHRLAPGAANSHSLQADTRMFTFA
jgi:hypothetical protein